MWLMKVRFIHKAFTKVRAWISYMNDNIGYHGPIEKIVLKTVTFSLVPIVVVLITTLLMFEGQFSDARSWISGDWREPLK